MRGTGKSYSQTKAPRSFRQPERTIVCHFKQCSAQNWWNRVNSLTMKRENPRCGIWLRAHTMVLSLILGSSSLWSQQQTQPKLLRFDLTPIVGYRTSTSFTTKPGIEGVSARVVLDASPSYGAAFGVRLDEDNLIEFRWARENTHSHVEGAVVVPSNGHVKLDQFHGDFTHEYTLEEWCPWIRPFVMASVGATHFSDAASNSFTRFSFGIGGGVKFFPTRHLGFKLQAQWLPILVEPEVVSFVCGTGCAFRLQSQGISQGEFAMGPVFRF
jgi:hypothetical protein